MLGTNSAERTAAIHDFEWVNAWAAQAGPAEPMHTRPLPYARDAGSAEAVSTKAHPPIVHVLESAFAADAMKAASALDAADATEGQLTSDIAAIERVRDALLAAENRAKPRISAVLAVPVLLRRTPDSVPVVLGSVLGMLMLVVFSAAAVFVKLAR